jgi:hypothetical protein
MSIEKSLNFDHSLLQNTKLWFHSQGNRIVVGHFTKLEIGFVGYFTKDLLLFE